MIGWQGKKEKPVDTKAGIETPNRTETWTERPGGRYGEGPSLGESERALQAGP